MRIRDPRPTGLSAGVCGVLLSCAVCATAVNAAPTTWTIDDTRSAITLDIPDAPAVVAELQLTLRFRNQVGQDDGPWDNGNVAPLGGTLFTEYVDGVSISFMSGDHEIDGLTSSNQRPNPAVFDPLLADINNPAGQYANASTTPAVFGSRTRATTFVGTTVDASYQTFQDVAFDVESDGVLPLTNGSFASDGLTLGISSMTVDLDSLFTPAGQPIPDQVMTVAPAALGTNLAAGGTVTTPDAVGDPDGRELTIPIDVDVVLDIAGISREANISGQIVAVPEPGHGNWVGAALVGLMGLAARGRLRRATNPAG